MSSNTKKKATASGPGSSSASRDQESDDSTPLFFYMPKEKYGEFCQWHPSLFAVSKEEISRLVGRVVDDSDTDGAASITVNCAEQFMMYCKAARFGDMETQIRILATTSPKEQKRLASRPPASTTRAGTRSRAPWSRRATWLSLGRTHTCGAN
ncbi:hypothetical protein TOPH_00368 [Tolypocladium ophioglossoides CBS 100239]|uniref:NADAR domain-containing protein n=1 Tax=Tolypocladium ophioglossoides (strain CBS 100239) TaxID=1163406 RepID=A0A0L0NMI4_TOLOC|nr:hypothetical protein TOPH_00368 [Tolypocladium ophioglossoides CBS 100239]